MRKPAFLLLLGSFVAVGIILSVYIPEARNIHSFLSISGTTCGQKMTYILSSFSALWTQNSTLSLVLLFLVVIFLSLNLALMIYYIKMHRSPRALRRFSKHSVVGFIAAVFGIGCAACGAALLGALLSLLGATSVILFLPLHGQELSLIAILVLSFGTYILLKHIAKPPVCNIELPQNKAT